MKVRMSEEEKEIYNYAITYHTPVAELRKMLAAQQFYRTPYHIVTMLQRLREEHKEREQWASSQRSR